MIQNFNTGRGFRGASNYVIEKEEAERLSCGTMQGKNPQELSKEASMFRALRPNMKKATVHVSLSAAPGDDISSEKWGEIAQEYMKSMGMEKCPWHAVRHHDESHDHIHIVGIRIDELGNAVSDSHSYRRGAQALQQIEIKHNLVQSAKTPEQAWQMSERSLTKDEIQMYKKTGQIPEKELIKNSIKAIFSNGSIQTSTFFEELKTAGITPIPNVTKAGNLTGISFQKEGITVKGSTLGKDFSSKGLQRIGLDFNQDRDGAYLQEYKKELTNGHKKQLESGSASDDTASRNRSSEESQKREHAGVNGTDRSGEESQEREHRDAGGADRATSTSTSNSQRERSSSYEQISRSEQNQTSELSNRTAQSGSGLDRRTQEAERSREADDRRSKESGRSSRQDEESRKNVHDQVSNFVPDSEPQLRDDSWSRIVDIGQATLFKGSNHENVARKPGVSTRNDREVPTMKKPAHVVAKEKSWERQASALKAPGYRITLTHVEKPGFNHGKGKGPDGGEKWFTADEVKNLIPFISAKNAQGYNVYITPQATENHYILLDDTDKQKLRQLESHGFKPALTQESSPNNIQAVFIVPKPEVSAVEQTAANNVMRRLNQQYGDPRITAVVHPFRMAGFANRKPKHEQDGKFPFVQIQTAPGGGCQKMTAVLDTSRSAEQVANDKVVHAQARVQAQERRETIENIRPYAYSPKDAHAGLSKTEFKFISERQRQQFHSQKMVESGKWKEVDESSIDFRVCKELARSTPPQELKEALVKFSPCIDERHSDMIGYAEKTVERATIRAEQEHAQKIERSQSRGMEM